MTDAAADAQRPARSGDLRNYALVTGAYWADTIADGAARVLVLFYFYERGYSPFEVASLFLFYELFGIVTNLVGGWLAARLGLKATLLMGLGTQLVALGMLAVAPERLARRALRDGRAGALGHRQGPHQDELQERRQARRAGGCAGRALPLGRGPDRIEERAQGRRLLPRRAAADRGRVPAGARSCSLALVLTALVVVLAASCAASSAVPTAAREFAQMFSNNRAVNVLAAARVFLFAARDVWFVVGLPVFLRSELGWSFWQAGAFLAVWVIGYGVVQAVTPGLARQRADGTRRASRRARRRRRSRSCWRRSRPASRSRSTPDSTRRSSSSRAWPRSASLRAQLDRALVPDPGLRRQGARWR